MLKGADCFAMVLWTGFAIALLTYPSLALSMTLSVSPEDIRNQPVRTQSESPVSDAEMQQAVRTLLLGLGEDPDREGLIDTPKRVVKALKYLTSG